MNKITLQGSFSLEQIQFLEQSIFDVLKSDFNYSLGDTKRKLVVARALGAKNADALRQRLKSNSSLVTYHPSNVYHELERKATDAWIMMNAQKWGDDHNVSKFIDSISHARSGRPFSKFASLVKTVDFLRVTQPDSELKSENWVLLRDIGVDLQGEITEISNSSKKRYEEISKHFLALHAFINRERIIYSAYSKVVTNMEEGDRASMWEGRSLPAMASFRLIHLINGRKGKIGFPNKLDDFIQLACSTDYPKSIMYSLYTLMRSLNLYSTSETPFPNTSSEQYDYIAMQCNKII